MRRTPHFLLLVAALLALFARDADALCVATRTTAILVTPLDVPVAADGSLLAGIQYGFDAGGLPASYGSAGEFTLPPLALVQRTRRVPVTQHPIPGGLIRLAWATPPPPGVYALEGFAGPGETPPSVTIGGVLPPPPAAPVLTSVTHQERHQAYEGPRGAGRWTHWQTRVELGQALPDLAEFLVVRTVGSTVGLQFFDARFGTTLEDSGTLGGRCEPGFVEGRGRVAVRAQVEAYVIDHFGRVSPPSAPVRVR
ncbi:MAG: hypothetical protein IPG17_15710 [Sandaracinaceae bacterium]|nr:hypothetical protein [Sandaracinaceae bacterium]